MTNPMSADLIAWGAIYTPAVAKPGEAYWRIVEASGPQNIGGNHHWYIDTLDLSGRREVGVPVEFFWDSDQQHVLILSEAKPGEEQALNLPLYAGGNAYGVRIVDGLPSDEISGIGLGDHVPHHSFRTVYKRTIATANEPPMQPPVQPEPTFTRDVWIAHLRAYLEAGL